MRLLSLTLDGQYKGLKDQTFNFEDTDDNVIAFIGLNGSGKSQLLELIAECFAYLERLQRIDFKNKGHLGFDFSLVYRMSGYVNAAPSARAEVFEEKLQIADGFTDPKFSVSVNGGDVQPIDVEQADQSIKIGLEQLPLPNVVGYSSGLNENLQRPFLKNANQLFKALKARARYHKEKRALDLSYENNRNDSESAFNQFRKNKIDLLKRYQRNHPYLFNFEVADYVEDEIELPETVTQTSNLVYLDYDSAQLVVSFIDFEYESFFVQDLAKKNSQYRLLYSTPTLLILEFDFTQPYVSDEVVESVSSFIQLAGEENVEYQGRKTTSEEFEYYELDALKGTISLDLSQLADDSRLSTHGVLNPFRLFERLYKTQQLGLKNISAHDRYQLDRNYFFGTVKKPLKVKLALAAKRLMLEGDNLTSVAFEELSDGESQLLQILAILKLYSQENTLFLLDEPETHLNPAWRTSFHKYVSDALNAGNKGTKSQVFLSTHSPFMVSSLKCQNVYQFRRDDNGFIRMNMVQNETYGASFDVLIKELFGLRSLISQSVIDEIRVQLEKGDEHAKKWIKKNLGLSAEKAYLIRKLSQ
ncbi:MAG: AAA family ATPase [Alteromonas sp.]|jgi:predicted ATPase|uniref:AAA family ATPase n=1 Tax=uncultured Alteromonas sp. TaxID=179113 RepID=UPI000C116D8E|nr:MAG: AAA family ATPase [Alteromonas sp.]|tara:strand:- start:3152 stop:4909 length:1758 start_codon:yes stop_codon:yes gene_type:complete